MKQLLIGLAVLAVFIAYSLGVRHEQPVVGGSIVAKASPTASGTDDSSGPSANPSGQTSTPTPSAPTKTAGQYKDGNYTGSVEDAFYGNVQVSATVSGGKLTDVTFLQYPNSHSDSVMINQQAMPLLRQEAIQKQTAQVDIISGATFTSQAFIQSLASALALA